MSAHNARGSHNRRGQHRGSRRKPHRNDRGSGSRRNGGPPSAARERKQPGLWQKIVAFFAGLGKPKPARVSAGGKHPARQTPAGVVSSPRLYVGNLSFDAVESDLFDLFNGVGKVQNAEIASHKYTEKSKGFGFVTMLTIDEAKRAVVELHGKEFMGRELVVSGARSNDARDVR